MPWKKSELWSRSIEKKRVAVDIAPSGGTRSVDRERTQ